jgi:hypothetical protein
LIGHADCLEFALIFRELGLAAAYDSGMKRGAGRTASEGFCTA